MDPLLSESSKGIITINKRGRVNEYKRLKLTFYDSERKGDIIMLKLLGDECNCFNSEFPPTIRKEAGPCISASWGINVFLFAR